MTINEIIASALPIAEKFAPNNVAPLKGMQAALSKAGLKVAVLGDFKAGKSTIINTLFLKEELLPRDYAESTAVPTYVTSGSPLLQTWKRNDDGSETMVSSTESFTAEDILRTVTAGDEDARGEMAEKYSRVVLQKPGILPEGITLVDTPGMNTTNERIIMGTKTESRSADAIIYVVRAKQLSRREEDFIKSLCGGGQNKIPVHIVVTDDGQNGMGALQEVEEAIRAQLRLRGIVAGTSVFIFGKEEKSGISGMLEKFLGGGDVTYSKDQNEDSVLSKMLGNIGTSGDSATSPEPVPAGERDIQTELVRFFETDVQRGRSARVSRDIAPILNSIALAVEQRLAVAKAGADRADEMEKEMREQQREYLRTVENLLADVATAELGFQKKLDKKLDSLEEEFSNDINQKADSAGVLQEIKAWQHKVPYRTQMEVELLSLELERDMRDIGQRYSVAMHDTFMTRPELSEVGGGWLTKIPDWMLTIADYLLFDAISPLPLILDIPLRMVMDKIPGLKELMPKNIATNMARRFALNELAKMMSSLKDQMHTGLEGSFNELNAKLRGSLNDDSVFSGLRKAIEDARSNGISPAEKQELESVLCTVNGWSKAI